MRYLITLFFAALSLNAIGQIQYDFPYNPDADNDAFVSSTDLLELLAIYGEAFSTDELYLSQDSTSLIVYVGDLMRQDCSNTRYHLEGNWAVIDTDGTSIHYNDLALDLGHLDDTHEWQYMWVRQSTNLNPLNLSLKNRNYDYYEYNQAFINHRGSFLASYTPSVTSGYTYECWCVTHQRPTVEYMHIHDLSEEEVNVLSSQGWVHTNASFGSNSASEYTGTLWRWAE